MRDLTELLRSRCAALRSSSGVKAFANWKRPTESSLAVKKATDALRQAEQLISDAAIVIERDVAYIDQLLLRGHAVNDSDLQGTVALLERCSQSISTVASVVQAAIQSEGLAPPSAAHFNTILESIQMRYSELAVSVQKARDAAAAAHGDSGDLIVQRKMLAHKVNASGLKSAMLEPLSLRSRRKADRKVLDASPPTPAVPVAVASVSQTSARQLKSPLLKGRIDAAAAAGASSISPSADTSTTIKDSSSEDNAQQMQAILSFSLAEDAASAALAVERTAVAVADMSAFLMQEIDCQGSVVDSILDDARECTAAADSARAALSNAAADGVTFRALCAGLILLAAASLLLLDRMM